MYRRSNVVSCKTAENWMRMGRRVKEKQEPLKWVKQRAVTLQKRRAQEQALQERGEAIQQGLYAEYQTEVYLPPPIEDVSLRLTFEADESRAPSHRTHLAISTFMPILCFLLARSICLVSGSNMDPADRARQGHCQGRQSPGYQLRRGLRECSCG